MFDENRPLDPLPKFLLHSVPTPAIEKMLWERITQDVSQWITVDLWGVITGHPWRTAVIVAGGLLVLLMLGLLVAFASHTPSAVYASPQDTLNAPDALAGPDMLTFRTKELSSMSATGLEQACSDRSPRAAETAQSRRHRFRNAGSDPQTIMRLADPAGRQLLRSWASAVAELAGEPGDRMLHRNLHHDNVLATQREPRIAIDPEPLADDPGFDLWPAQDSR